MRELWINLLLLVAIVLIAWALFTIEERDHIAAFTPKALEEMAAGHLGDSTRASSDGGGISLEETTYSNLGRVNLFNTLIPTPTPPPPEITPPPQIPPLREALRGRWKMNYTFGNQAVWTDQQNNEVKLLTGETVLLQFGQFEYTIRLASVDEDSFTANLETTQVRHGSTVLAIPDPLPLELKAQYSMLQSNLNP